MKNEDVKILLIEVQVFMKKIGKQLSSDNKQDYFFDEFASGFDGQEKQDLKSFFSTKIDVDCIKCKNIESIKEEYSCLMQWAKTENPDLMRKSAIKMAYQFLFQAIKKVYKI